MDWQSLLNTQRLFKDKEEDAARPNYTMDADRIIFSAPFRRLANKTQVHPLHGHDHLRHRMIHSNEVATVGRSLGMQIGAWLEVEKYIGQGEAHRVAGIIHAACLAHDIGNPPFGHSGEESIGKWFAERFQEPRGVFRGIDAGLWPEFEAFEGNAQGFRILTRLEMYRGDYGMDLSAAVLGAFTKYPMTARTRAVLTDHSYVGAKKFGLFDREAKTYARVADRLGLIAETAADGSTWWRRHPLVFLVEAADDICYNIVDLEDGYTARDLSFDQVRDLLLPLIENTPNDDNLGNHTEYEKISHYRALAIGGAIWACVEAFKANHDAIMNGTYSNDLIADSALGPAFARIKKTAREQLFVAPRKTKLEVRGRNVIRNVLDGLLPVFDALAERGWDEAKLPDYERQVVRALELDLRGVTDSYSALHAMTDFVSGMTDRYAVDTAEMLMGR
ncbi:Deoxyguanosinetriphosphate triphosphohydrolase [Pelagimonas phthalicica]|uniref:Deoxyguanosinetriphosphate triphosphohydrolase n=1 Tax=Pelagimonas phthalicica TaxID=1037362 RepID=A0A238J9W3_9RHOB|nr:dNTP triphosphohydrolase [Pelagimonas phthalicica]TDS94805.1 dGTPase [Pelagimonas phthalicica]SMX26666.1 Deoxyguanosinetriphosphate triphosphohydrolase [Pelagimonas phthalicica]